MLLLAQLPDPIRRTRLHSASALESAVAREIRFARGWPEVHALAADSAADLLVFDPCDRGVFDPGACTTFHRAFPSVVLLPYSPVPLTGPDLLGLAALGVRNAVVQGDGDSPCTLGRVLNESLAQATAGRVLSALTGYIPEHLSNLFLRLLLVAHRPVSPDTLARTYFRHPKTLREHLKAAGLPRTQELIGWARLFHAAHRLGDSGRSVEGVALALEFPSGAALRNQLQRYAGVGPRCLPAAGGLDFVLERFRARCLELK